MDYQIQINSYESIILFDGVCNLCIRFVRFVIAKDKKEIFRFVPVQSEKGRELLNGAALKVYDLNTILLLRNGKVYSRSDAVLKILRNIGNVWSLFYAFIIVPKPIRDGVYSFISAHRYCIFSKRQSCIIPAPEQKGDLSAVNERKKDTK